MQIGAASGPGLASLTAKQSTNLDCTNKYFKAGDYNELLYSQVILLSRWVENLSEEPQVLTNWILNVSFPDDVLFAKCR